MELMIDRERMANLKEFRTAPYLLLVAEMPERIMTRVLVSMHQGYLFIQTNQPVYKPSEQVMYRIFTLDHTMRPVDEPFEVAIFNPDGHRLHVNAQHRVGSKGLSNGYLNLPDVAGLGTWKISAHYEGEEKHATTVEFEVQKYVLPSFEVNIVPAEPYIFLERKTFPFTIAATYTYGKQVNGSFSSWFRVVPQHPKDTESCPKSTQMILGLEKIGTIKEGKGTVTLLASELKKQLQAQGCNLTELGQQGAALVMAVSVTEQQSSEVQEEELSLPIISSRYVIDLSRTRSHYIPGTDIIIMVLLRLPDGSPAADVPVEIYVLEDDPVAQITNPEGAVLQILSPTASNAQIVVKVKVDNKVQEKVIKPMSSTSQHYLQIDVHDGKLSVGQQLRTTFHIITGVPQDGFLYFLVLSRGMLIKQGSVKVLGSHTFIMIQITADMIPSLRLIGYYYNQNGVVISDSVWLDVIDECATTLSSNSVRAEPGELKELTIEVPGEARVALVAVDTAMYSINKHNRLTSKQVYSAMESYDLGCSYGGGPDTDSVFTHAGLSFLSPGSHERKIHGCKPLSSRRARRSVDLRHELVKMKWNMSTELQECCAQGFSPILMRRSCKERQGRVSEMSMLPQCAEVFLRCCLQGEALRKEATQDNGLGRTSGLLEIEEYFISNTARRIRRNFDGSFEFTYYDVIDKKTFQISLPDSITTWEIQAATLSLTHGFCVTEPYKLTAMKDIFVSLRLPYSVKKYEQMSVVAVIYNYGSANVQLAAHMEQVPGLCSPGSATLVAYVNVSVAPQSSELVAFVAVPMESGQIPIKIRLYDIIKKKEIDAVEKLLNVLTVGAEQNSEYNLLVKFDGRTTFQINGLLPDETVPGSISNIVVKMEGASFGTSSARSLLSADGVADLLKLPGGCAEQIMKVLAPTVLALRYLDLSQQWVELPPGTRDKALHNTDEGVVKILSHKKDDGSYGVWKHHPTSHWLTALVVKVLSMLAERQSAGVGQRGFRGQDVTNQDISHSVSFLLSVQKDDGSFSDPHPVIYRRMQGGLNLEEDRISMTAFITVALKTSLPFVENNLKNSVVVTINKATTYILSNMKELKRTYAVAIVAYCLAVCLPNKTESEPAWRQLQALSTLDDKGCRVWNVGPTASAEEQTAITVEATAYALMTAVAHRDIQWADKASCWLVAQENYGGGFKSTQDTIVALEALAEYDVNKPTEPFRSVEAELFVEGRSEQVTESLRKPTDRVEMDIPKSMTGKMINVVLTGKASVKMKVKKTFYMMEHKDTCRSLNIDVTVLGKAQYAANILDNYEYFSENYEYEAVTPHATQARLRRAAQHSSNSENSVMRYRVCVSLNTSLTGMAIADITLLSGFEVETDDLDRLKDPPEVYISHYEVSSGRVILYFNKVDAGGYCVEFNANQTVPISLLQPAQASFYDYYEPKTKCKIFYFAPGRTTQVSKLCSDDVCQCAERPCHEVKNLFLTNMKRGIRLNHACFHPRVDYRFVVEVLNMSSKSIFQLYHTRILKVLRSNKDTRVVEDSTRVFAKRLQCKAQLEEGKQYLIMGKDGSTTDSHGEMQYLLESNTWVELVPEEKICNKTERYKLSCKAFHKFVSDFGNCRS